jgi:adenylate kinase family enzyme
MRRVLVIGSGGAGKTTLSLRIAQRTGLPVIHLDSLYWRPGWVPTPAEEWQRAIADLVQRPRWIMDGNYGGTLETRLAAADTVVFLDVPRLLCLRRVLERRIRHDAQSRPSLASGCPERLTAEFLWWIWTYPTRRRNGILARLEELRDRKAVAILRSGLDVERFVDGLASDWSIEAGE